MKKAPTICIPTRQELNRAAQQLHDAICASFPDVQSNDEGVVDGLADVLEVCANYHRNLALRGTEIDNNLD